MVAVTIKALQFDETNLLIRAAVDNFNWDVERFTSDDVLASAEMVRYTEFIPKRGDFGFVAWHEETPVGIVWALFLPRERPGWGFVESATPEVSLWVDAAFRRRGIGRALLRAAQHATRMRDLTGLSLSVEPDNPARDLYRSEGFEDLEEKATDGVMVWRRA